MHIQLLRADVASLKVDAMVTSSQLAESGGSVGLPPLWVRRPELLERCARNMLQAAIDFRVRTRSVQRVVFCIFGGPAYETWDRLLRELDR